MTNTSKVQKIAITAFIVVVMAFLFLNLFTVQAHAAGLLDETIDTAHEFSRYPIDNYQLDFYVDSSWDWLPWNWLDGIGKTAQYAIYLFTNFLWTLNLYISNAVGYLIQQAYDLDFISSAASEIGKNIQLIAGVSASGFDSTGLFPGMMAIVTLLVGVYCTYAGLIKRETTKAFHAALNFVVVFVVSVGLIAYAPSAITGVNEFSSDISNGIVDVSAKILAPDTAGENTGVSAIRDCLFGIQVKQPWLIMQFGDSDVENIGEERVNSLLGTSPDENRGKDREEVVKSELEDYDNGNLTVTEVTSRFGLSVFFLIFNLIVSAFAIMLTGSMLLSQILFIISAMFLPVSLLISMIPAFSGTSRRAVISLFNTIMLRVGTTLLTTFVLVLSSLAYTIANGKPFVVVVLLQVIVFAGVYMERDKLLGMIGLRDEGTGRVGRAMTNRPRRTISRAVRKALPFAAGVGVGKRSAQRRIVQSSYYPVDYQTGWSRDNYGPLWIPKKGTTIPLTERNIALYKRCIVNYEHNKLEVKDGKVYINGKPETTYTFKYDYYWMMGDNRHNSADSRSWGFVPEDHIVGKPIMIWLSLDKDRSLFDGGIRWNRMFRWVHPD